MVLCQINIDVSIIIKVVIKVDIYVMIIVDMLALTTETLWRDLFQKRNTMGQLTNKLI